MAAPDRSSAATEATRQVHHATTGITVVITTIAGTASVVSTTSPVLQVGNTTDPCGRRPGR